MCGRRCLPHDVSCASGCRIVWHWACEPSLAASQPRISDSFSGQCGTLRDQFFLTPNPYAALHSGGVALDALIHSESFAIQSNILTAASLLAASVYAFRSGPALPAFAIVFAFLLLLSGLATAVIFQRPQSYAFDAILMTMVIALARHGALSEIDGRTLRKVFRYSFVILVAAIVLALLKPNVWGFLPFEFSRDSRGEATFGRHDGNIGTCARGGCCPGFRLAT